MIARTSARALLGLPLLLGLGALLLAQSGPSTIDPSAREFLLAKLARKLEKVKKRPRPYDQPAEAQEFYVLKRAAPGEKVLHPEKYLEALEHMRRMPRYSTAQGEFLLPLAESKGSGGPGALALGSWTALGPGNIGGRTRGLVIDPGTPNTMYAAGVSGGVWKTTDGGATWAPLTDLIANLAVSILAMDPNNSSILYAGTGEGVFNADAVRGAGIFKTTNGGTNWTQLANTNNSNFHYVMDIVVSHNNSSRVYAATRTGIWRSVDGGTNWTSVHSPAAANSRCLDLEIRRDQANDYLFASCGTFAQASVYRNVDAAGVGTWNSVLTDVNMGRTHLAIAPSTPATIYAVSASITGGPGGNYLDGLYAVWRSTSNGDSATWTIQVQNTNATKLNTVLLTNTVYAFLTECSFGTSAFFNQGWYDNVIAVDPANADIVWVGGIDLFRSDNAGVSWGMASHWWASTANSHFAHADQHAVVFHPGYNGSTNKIMFVGNDGGLFRTNDARAATATGALAPCSTSNGSVAWTELNNTYGVTQFYYGVPYPSGTTYFGGTQDNGTIRGSDAGGAEAWTEMLGGDGGYVAVDPSNTNILYAENTDISIQKCTLGLACNDQTDWVDATTGITGDTGLFITPFIMDPSNSSRLWTGGTKMWRTSNAASSWSQAGVAFAQNVSAIAVAPTDSDRVLAGLRTVGTIHRTTTGTTSTSSTAWSSVTPRAGYVSWLTFDPTDSNIAYATYSTFGGGAHVWMNTNVFGGGTWTAIDGTPPNNIPDIPVHSLVVDPSNTQRLFVGTDLGVFSTTDGGANWAVEDTGFAHVVVEALAIEDVGATPNVFAFTHGRGAWRVGLPPPGPTLTIDDVTVAEGNAGTVNAVFTVTLNPTAGGDVTVDFTTANNTASAGSDYNLNSGQVTITTGNSTQTITVQVLGDTLGESNETFFVNLSNATGGGATIGDSQGVGTITNDDAPPGTFTGKVKNAAKQAVVGATVGAYQSAVLKFSTTSNSVGVYSLPVTAGTYDLVASKPADGYLDTTRAGMAVSSGQTLTRVKFKLYRQSFFQGTVTQKGTTTPIDGVLIEAIQGSTVVNSTTTAVDGTYSLPITQGTYTLRASKTGFVTKSKLDQTIGDNTTRTGVNFPLKPTP